MKHSAFRSVMAAAVFAAGALLSAQSAAAATEFLGGGYIHDFANCTATGWSGNDSILVRIRPGGMPGNDPTDTKLTLFFGRGAINYSSPLDAVNVWFTPLTTSVFAAAYQFSQTQIRVLSLEPATITPTTPLIYAVVEFADFEGETGCTATAQVVAALR